MSNVGCIGTMYSNRKSGKVGKLLSRNDDEKVLTFVDDNDEEFQVTYGQFKSNWRKMPQSDENDAVEPDDEVITTPKIEVVDTRTEMEKVDDFCQAIRDARDATVGINESDLYVEVDGIKIIQATKLKHCIHAEMLPDVYTYSNWANKIVVGTVHFNGRGDMCVNLDAKEIDFGDLLTIIKPAVVDLNLYGYTYE